jgi:hypothetical protein
VPLYYFEFKMSRACTVMSLSRWSSSILRPVVTVPISPLEANVVLPPSLAVRFVMTLTATACQVTENIADNTAKNRACYLPFEAPRKAQDNRRRDDAHHCNGSKEARTLEDFGNADTGRNPPPRQTPHRNESRGRHNR